MKSYNPDYNSVRRKLPAGGLVRQGRRWWFKVKIRGEKPRWYKLVPKGQKLSTTNRDVAMVLAHQICAGLKLAGPRTELGDLLASFMATEFTGVTGGQKDHALFVLGRLCEGNAYPEDLTIDAVGAILQDLAERGRSPKTISNHRATMSRFCKFLVRRGHLARNPVEAFKPPKLDRPFPRFLSDREIAIVLRLAKRQGIWEEVMVALYSGLRLSELMRLRREDCRGGMIHVRESKSGRPRAIPIHPKLKPILSGRKQGLVFPERCKLTWLRLIRPVAQKVPIFHQQAGARVGRGWHLFRHSFASRAVQRGVDIRTVAQWLGHADIRTTMRYAHLAPGHGAEDIGKL